MLNQNLPATAIAGVLAAQAIEPREYLGEAGPLFTRGPWGFGFVLSARTPRLKEGLKTPELPELGVLHTHLLPAAEAAMYYGLEVPATYACRGIDRSIDFVLPYVDRSMELGTQLVEKIKGIELPQIKIKTLFDKKVKEEPVQAVPVAPIEKAISSVDLTSAATAGTEAVHQIIVGANKADVSAPTVTSVVGNLSLDLPKLDMERPAAEHDEGGGFSGSTNVNISGDANHFATQSMADTLNEKYADFFDKKFDSIRHDIDFVAAWLGDDAGLEAMYNDEDLANTLGVGFQVRCIDTHGRKIIATGTAMGPVIVYQVNPNSRKLACLAPIPLKRCGLIRSASEALEINEYERVLGSLDGKSMPNIGKACAQLVHAASHKA